MHATYCHFFLLHITIMIFFFFLGRGYQWHYVVLFWCGLARTWGEMTSSACCSLSFYFFYCEEYDDDNAIDIFFFLLQRR